MIAEAHELGLRVLLDIVPNHLSDQHAWFQEALAAGPGSRERARFIFRDGRGRTAISRPTTGAAASADRPGLGSPRPTAVRASGTCTCSRPSSPTSTGPIPRSGRVRADDAVLVRHGRRRIPDRRRPRPGQGRRAAGHRVDRVAAGHRRSGRPSPLGSRRGSRDLPEWRALADAYDDPRVFVAEAWVHNPRAPCDVRPRRRAAHGVQLRLPAGAVAAEPMRDSIVDSLNAHEGVGAPPTWVLSNHDTVGRCRATRDRRASASCAISTTCWTCPPISSSARGARGPRRC